ncbi:hypothetical protein GCM10023237_50620 [Streptomyces coeruleoprunus]
MLHIGLAPGLSPSPGRSWLRTTLLVPIHAFRSAQCTGPHGHGPTGFARGGRRVPVGRAVFRRGRVGDPGGHTGQGGFRTGQYGDYRRGSWAQGMQARLVV